MNYDGILKANGSIKNAFINGEAWIFKCQSKLVITVGRVLY